jgi:hypothetical protein
MNGITPAETIIHSGRIATIDRRQPFVSALAIAHGRVLAIGDLDALAAHRADATAMIEGPHGRAGSQRLAHAYRPGGPHLQHGAALGWVPRVPDAG